MGNYIDLYKENNNLKNIIKINNNYIKIKDKEIQKYINKNKEIEQNLKECKKKNRNIEIKIGILKTKYEELIKSLKNIDKQQDLLLEKHIVN